MPTTRSQTASTRTKTETKTKTKTAVSWSNCTASSPRDPRAGLMRPKTDAARRKAFWAGSSAKRL